jgi:hypothetical protein
MSRVGQNRINTPYMTVYLVISLPKIPYIHRKYMVLANPTYESTLTLTGRNAYESTYTLTGRDAQAAAGQPVLGRGSWRRRGGEVCKPSGLPASSRARRQAIIARSAPRTCAHTCVCVCMCLSMCECVCACVRMYNYTRGSAVYSFCL